MRSKIRTTIFTLHRWLPYLKNAQKASLGDRILNWFTPLHSGTFWSLPSRILYVFVELVPVVLLSTGLVMWKHRQRAETRPPLGGARSCVRLE